MSQPSIAGHTFIPVVRRCRFNDCEFKASLGCIASQSRAALA